MDIRRHHNRCSKKEFRAVLIEKKRTEVGDDDNDDERNEVYRMYLYDGG